MHDTDLYARILGIGAPWQVEQVELRLEAGDVLVRVGRDGTVLQCPTCGAPVSGYDRRERRWRHLDTCQYRTVVIAEIPRVQCPRHGVQQIPVPWAEPGARFTALFEALVIDWLQVASLAAVARQLRLSWDEVDGIQARAVQRGLARRRPLSLTHVGVDETSFRKRHEYVTVVSNLQTSRVVHVEDQHEAASLAGFYAGLTRAQRAALKVICMDMWRPYIAATRRWVPDAERKIAFDKFHVAQRLGDAVDRVRRREHHQRRAAADHRLTGTRYWWLTNPASMDAQRWRAFAPLRQSTLKTARAWALKQLAMSLWRFRTRAWAAKAWKRWLAWALRCRLEPMRKVARSIRKHLEGILNAIVAGVTNARAEALNTQIQRLKRMACGFRSRQRFRHAIYFHLGGLDMYPGTLQATHSKA
ncbi:MAG TPA: ISL3 family transposase [Gemmatimonadales bacterium]|jgi:transposase